MGRLGRALAILGPIVFLLPPVVLAGNAVSPGRLPLINGSVNSSQWEALPYNRVLRRCTSADCTALKSIVRSFEYLGKRDFPNTMARIGPPPPPPKGPVPLASDVTLHPELREPSCKLLLVLAKNYFDWTVGLYTLELASLISTGKRDCLKPAILALPGYEDIWQLVPYAKQLCVARSEPNCSAISFK